MNERAGLQNEFRRGMIDKHEYFRAMTVKHAVLSEYVELLSNSDIDRIEITDEGVWLHSRLAPIYLAIDLADQGTPGMVSLNVGKYERAEFDMLQCIIPRSATVADIGANIGWYSAHIAALDPTAQIVAFEPVPSSFNWLCKTLVRNAFPNLVAEQLALSNRAGVMEIFVDPAITGAASEPVKK